jgi:hypothetical protein
MVFLASIKFTGRSSPFSPASYSLQVVSLHWRIISLPSRTGRDSLLSREQHSPDIRKGINTPVPKYSFGEVGNRGSRASITVVVAGLVETGWGIGVVPAGGYPYIPQLKYHD